MGLADKFAATVLTTYKADTKQMRSELKKLTGEEKKRADAVAKQAEAGNEAIDSQIVMLGKAAAAVGAVVAAYKIAQVGLEAFEKRSRLASATVGVNLAGLQKATKGLVSETRLLEFASKAMNGTFKLSQQQMEQAVTGALALRKTLGVDLQKALEITQKSITEGTTEPLKELGIVVKGVENDTREGLNAALKELANQARLAGPDLAIPGDSMSRSQVAMADSVDRLKISLGELSKNLAPVIQQLADMVSNLVEMSQFLLGGESLFKQGQAALERRDPFNSNIRRNSAPLLAGTTLSPDTSGSGAGLSGAIANIAGQFRRSGGGRSKGKRGGSGGGFQLSNSAIIDGGIGGDGSGFTGAGSLGHSNIANGNRQALAALEGARGASQGGPEAAAAGLASLNEQAAEAMRLADQAQGDMLASLFGTPSEIDAKTVAIQQLSGAMDGLAGAFGAGVDAMITGSEGFASAFKNAIGESLRAMAVEMTMQAVRHTAFGLGSLAVGNVPGATGHFTAAAQFGAGALAAGVGARLMGAGQVSAPSASAGAGSAGVGSASPANSNQGGNSTIVILGDDYGSQSARERESRIRESMRGAGISATGDFVVNG